MAIVCGETEGRWGSVLLLFLEVCKGLQGIPVLTGTDCG